MYIYLLKSGLCLLVLFSFYKLFLENEQFHGIKRIYLLASLIISFSLPFISITYGEQVVELTNNTDQLVRSSTNPVVAYSNWEDYLKYTLFSIYVIGVVFFAFRFCKNMYSLLKRAKGNERLKKLNYIFVLLGKTTSPHSFFNYIFLNKSEYKNDRISDAVIEHEKAHVDQKHSLDLLFVEILQIVFWFNPLFVWLKKCIKLNHEFLADREVLSKNFNALDYSNILINYSSGYHHNSLSSPINHSLIKKRIIMITKTFSLRRLLLKTFIFLPILSCCVYLFNEEIVAKTVYVHAEPDNLSIVEALHQDKRTIIIRVENEKIWLNKKLVDLDEFSNSLNKLTNDWSQDEMRKPWFEIDFQNATTEFIQKLNKEYRKSKLSKISGTEFLAPSPVAPAGTPPPPPPPPVVKRDNNIPPPPPPAPSEEIEMVHREKAREWRELKNAEREIIKEERQRIKEIESQLSEDEKLTEAERKKMLQELRSKEVEIQRKKSELKRKHAEIEREHLRMERVHKSMRRIHDSTAVVPKAPDPIESIDELEEEGGSFYHNGNEISAREAKKLVRAKNYSKIEIHQTGDARGKLEIINE